MYYHKTQAKRKQYRLIKKLKPVPTIFYPEESQLSAEPKYSPISVPRKSLTKRVYQQDQFKLSREQEKIKSFDDIDSTLTPMGYTFQKYDNHVAFYHLETNMLNVPEVTDCVRLDQDLHVKLFYKGSPLPLPQWFCHGRDCRLTRKNDAKLPKLYQIRGRADVKYSGGVQRAQIQEKKNILVQCYSISTSSTLYFLTNIPIINERVSISFIVSTEKNH